jgi:hypothetical protein
MYWYEVCVGVCVCGGSTSEMCGLCLCCHSASGCCRAVKEAEVHVGCVSGGTSGTKIQDQHSAQRTLPNAVPAFGMQIYCKESYRECRECSAVL